MLLIGFNLEHFTYRGTSVAVFDYAYYNEKLLGNKSVILIPNKQSVQANFDVVKKFKDNFPIYPYEDNNNLTTICIEKGITHLYFINSGSKISLPNLPSTKILIHCVYHSNDFYGDVYASISESVAKTSSSVFPVVPHIVNIVDDIKDLREQLDIPNNAIVFGRLGGEDTFNILFVKEAIMNIVKERKDIYFLFAVKPLMFNSLDHPQIKYTEAFWNDKLKRRFINTCDAMIHACNLGESFGLAVLEFASCGKPIITFNGGSWHTQHLKHLGEMAIKYNNKGELFSLLNNFRKENITEEFKDKMKRLVEPFSPEKIMKIWKEVFIEAKPK